VIDEEVLEGEKMAAEIKGLLIRDGFVDPDLRYVGRWVRPRSAAEVAEAASVERRDGEEDVWDGDGLD
jgi:hypothetical protein